MAFVQVSGAGEVASLGVGCRLVRSFARRRYLSESRNETARQQDKQAAYPEN
jgi:hypothetical protein